MASDFVRFQQDPSWGNLFTNLTQSISNAPKAALDQKLTVEQIWALRQKQAQEKAQFDANMAAGNAAATSLGQTPPPMSTRDIEMQWQGPSNPSDPATPLGEVFLPPSTVTEQYLDPVVAERHKRDMPFFQATARAQAFKDPHNLPGVWSKGQVALGGVPSDPQRQQQLEFQNTGKFDKTKGDNYIAVKPDGTLVAVMGTSSDGRYNARGEDMERLKPPGTVLMRAGERGMTPSAADNTVKNWGVRGPDGQIIPGSERASVTQPSPQHVRAGELTLGPRTQALPNWGVIDRRTGRVIPETIVAAERPPNSNYVSVGSVPATPGTDQNWVQKDSNGQVIPGSVVTSPTQPGPDYVRTGEVSQTPTNRVGTPAERLGLLAEYADKVVAQGHKLTHSEAVKLAFALEEQYKLSNKLQADAKGNIVKFTGFQEHEIPQGGPHRALAQAVNEALGGGAGAATAPAVQGNAINPPPMGTQVVSAGEAKDAIARTASAVGRAETARQNLETQIGIVGGQMPAIPYVPNLGAAIIAEKNNGIVGGALISAIDPKAPQYLADSKAWVEAVLRLASGAAIRTEEYADYAQMFVPNRNDSREQIMAKLDRMKQWAQITSTAQTADEAHKMLMNVSKGDPVFTDMAVRMRNLAEQNGTLTTPFSQLPQPGQQTGVPAGAPNPSVINRILQGGQ